MQDRNFQDGEDRLRTILRNSTIGYTLLTADGTVVERTSSAINILGLNENESSATLREDLVHPDDLQTLRNAYSVIKNNPDSPVSIEYRFCMPDGSYKWIETTLHNQLHEPTLGIIVLSHRDITYRKSVELALKTSEARLNEAQAVGKVGSWEINLKDGTSLWSDEMFRALGVKKTDIEPSYATLANFIHPDDRAAIDHEYHQAIVTLQNGTTSYRIVRPDGEIRYADAEWRFEFDEEGNPTRLYGIHQDVTDRKEAEIALEKSEDKYKKLFNNSPTPKWVYDVETYRFLDVNEAAIKHYGYSRDEFLSMSITDVLPQEEIKPFEEILKTYKGTNDVFCGFLKHIKKNGALIDVDVQCNSIEISGREVRIIIASDISERLNYIRAIEEQNSKLREIAWLQSHKVRAPLARIMGLIELLDANHIDKDDTGSIIKTIYNSAQELDKVVREIVKKTE